MKVHLHLIALLLVVGACITTSCVSKKKFLTETSLRDSTNQLLNNRVIALNREIGNLQLQLSEKTGEAKTLRELYNQKERTVKSLEEEVENLGNRSLTQQQLMDINLREKDVEIEAKRKELWQLRNYLTDLEQRVKTMMSTITVAMPQYPEPGFSMEVKGTRLYIRIAESLLFRKGSTAYSAGALELLEKLAFLLGQHPDLRIGIEAHTDNTPPGRNFQDNWDLSALRAASVSRTFTREYELNPSQVTAIAKGEFEPIASNETDEGRLQNRRIVLVVEPSLNPLFEIIRQIE